MKQILRDQGAADKSYENCNEKGDLLAMISAEQSGRGGYCGNNRGLDSGFRRPFKLLSDHEIMNFLDVNEIPSEIDDVRFLRYVNDHERLAKGLFLPFLFDQRVTLFFFRFHGRTYITLDADLDNFVNTIDELSEPRFWLQFLVAPSYALFDSLNSIENESSVDEFLRFLFLFLSWAEGFRFLACIIYIVSCKYLNKAASYSSISWSIFKFDIFEFCAIITLSCMSYTLWDGYLSSSKLQFLFYIELFGLPIWYFRTFMRIGSFVLDAVFKCMLLWTKFNFVAPFKGRLAKKTAEANASLELTPSHSSSRNIQRASVLQSHQLSLNHSLPPAAPSVQQIVQSSSPRAELAEFSPDAPVSPTRGLGTFFFGARFAMVSRPELYQVLPSDVIVNEPVEVLGEGKFGIVLKAKYVNGDAVIKLSKSRESLPIQEECKCHFKLSNITTCVADLKGFVKESHDGRRTLRECFDYTHSAFITACC